MCSARPLCPQEMALVIIIKPIIMLGALYVHGLVSRGVLTQRQPKPDPIFLPPVNMLWQVRWGKMGKGTSSSSRSLRVVPDNRVKNRNPFTFVISNHCSFHLFIHLVIHLNSRTLGSCPQQIPAPLSCPLLWVDGDSILGHRVCSVPVMHSTALQPAGPQWLRGEHLALPC